MRSRPVGAGSARDPPRDKRGGSRYLQQEDSVAATIRRAAIELLARREQSTAELRGRLQRKFGSEAPIEPELERLAAERLLDDTRFVEAFVRMHRQRGHGPMRILHELSQRGVDATLAESIVEPRAAEWTALARRWRERRFGDSIPKIGADWQRQARHLQSRGFSAEQVRRAMKGDFQE